MKYDKSPLSFEQQADLLIKRGLIVDRAFLIDRLKDVNYYRLSGYLYPYRQLNDNFKLGTTFDKVWRHYTFDRRLRLIVMDAIERFEVSIKTQLIFTISNLTGPFGYLRASNFKELSIEDHQRLIEKIVKEQKRSKERFVEHFRNKYGKDHEHLPLWMAGEIMSFGSVLTMYRGLSNNIKQNIAVHYGVSDAVLTSWLQVINFIRNVCAHHGRLWNRELGIKPYIPRKNKYPKWHEPSSIEQNKIFCILTILQYLLKKISPQSKWKDRLFELLDEYPDISRWSMGFPDYWRDFSLWKDEIVS